MDTAWIQVFVLTIAECVAPAGKTVCQEHEFDLQFLTRADCEVALEQLVSLKEASTSVIVNRSGSRCTASARELEVFESLEAVSRASRGFENWEPPRVAAVQSAAAQSSHQERLADLPDCEAADGRAPCKVGDIIVESAVQGEAVEVWRRKP